MQDEITETIVGRIDTELRASEIDRARRKPPANLDAWELYQRGLWHFYKMTKEGNEEARTLFLKAVERDPNFALPYASIAITCFIEVTFDYGDNPAERLTQGLAAGERAVALDDKDGLTHFAHGRMLHMVGQGERAIAELEKCVALNPSMATGYLGLALTLNWYGRAADAIPRLDMAMRLSPQDQMLWAMQNVRSSCCNNLENYDEAVEWARKAINARADLFGPRLHLARAFAELDRLDEARVAIEEARRVKPGLSLSVIRRILPHHHPEYLERHIGALRKAGLPERTSTANSIPNTVSIGPAAASSRARSNAIERRPQGVNGGRTAPPSWSPAAGGQADVTRESGRTTRERRLLGVVRR